VGITRRSGSGGVETLHRPVRQTGTVNPADAADSDVCIPTAVTLFLWE